MRKVLIITMLLLSTTLVCQAGLPSRVRMLIHGHKQIDSTFDIRTRFIPAGNLIGELKPLIYLGLDCKLQNVAYIEPVVGWSFDTDEPILALVTFTKIPLPANAGSVWSWWDMEFQTRTKTGYVFAQMEYEANDWYSAGIEMELWGNWSHGPWNVGCGMNILLRYGVVGVDLACHYRRYNEQLGAEFVTRFHLFF